MDSKRLRVLKALTSQLETITVSNGYDHDLLGKVARGRVNYGRETVPPYVAIFEVRPEDMPIYAGDAVQKDNWIIGIEGTVASGNNHPTDPSHNLLADIKKSLGAIMSPGEPGERNPNYMFGNEIVSLEADGGLCFVHSDAPNLALCVMKIVINIAENLENPYE